jgi:hypothetical protein
MEDCHLGMKKSILKFYLNIMKTLESILSPKFLIVHIYLQLQVEFFSYAGISCIISEIKAFKFIHL